MKAAIVVKCLCIIFMASMVVEMVDAIHAKRSSTSLEYTGRSWVCDGRVVYSADGSDPCGEAERDPNPLVEIDWRTR